MYNSNTEISVPLRAIRCIDGFVAIGIVYDSYSTFTFHMLLHATCGTHTFDMLRTSQLICTTVWCKSFCCLLSFIILCVCVCDVCITAKTLNKHWKKEWVTASTGTFCINRIFVSSLMFHPLFAPVHISAETKRKHFDMMKNWEMHTLIHIFFVEPKSECDRISNRIFTFKAKINVPFNRLTMQNDVKNSRSK